MKKKALPLWFVAALAWFGYHCGAGFASGRQAWLYAAQFGKLGMIAPVIIWIACTIFMYVAAEYARLTRAKNYRGMVSIYYDHPVVNRIALLLWDILVAMATVTVCSSCTAGTGSLLNDVFGIPYVLGCVLFIIIMVCLLCFGHKILERVGKFGIPLIVVFFIICFAALFKQGNKLPETLAMEPVVEITTWQFIKKCFIYAITQSSFFQALAVLAGRFADRKATIKFSIAGFAMNFLAMVASYFALMSYYPGCGDSSIPMFGIVSQFGGVGGTLLMVGYNFVLFMAYITTVGGAIAGANARYTPLLIKWLKKDTWCRVFVILVFMACAWALSNLGLDGILTTVNTINSTCRFPIWYLPFLVLGPFSIAKLRKKELAGELPPIEEE